MEVTEKTGVSEFRTGIKPETALKALVNSPIIAEGIHRWMTETIHKIGWVCPFCGHSIGEEKRLRNYLAGKKLRCGACKKEYTRKTGTIMAGTSLEETDVFLIAVLTDLDVRRPTIAWLLGVHEDTVANWQAKFMAMEVRG